MSELVPNALHTELHIELRALIASSRQRLAGAVNAELTRMVQFAQAFPLPEIVATLTRQLSWSHFVNLLQLKTEHARQFYASQAAANTWSVRELRQQIERKTFERTEHAALQGPKPIGVELVEAAEITPALVFKDPYFLDFLGLRQGHDEADLEVAILRQLEAFILELGRGFAFVERQKRMVIAGDDFYLDLLFYHRRLRRLVAIELKLGRFKAAHRGQMELYLRPPSALSCAPNLAANKWSCCKCTKTASPWPNTGLNCHPKRSCSKSCMQRCLKRVSGWQGAGCCWGTWMMSDDMKVSKGLPLPVVAMHGVGHIPAN